MKAQSKTIALPPAPGPALSFLLTGFAVFCWLLFLWPALDNPFARFLLAMLTEALCG